MVVSEIIDKLSPNIAPPTTVPIANALEYQLPAQPNQQVLMQQLYHRGTH